jgi:predicted transcriptional regulator
MAYKLKAAGINDFNLNILTSVAKYVFDLNNENSIRRIEIEALKNSFTINGYSVVDAITGVMDRTMDSTYTQAVYSKESNMVEVTTKKKGAARKG